MILVTVALKARFDDETLWILSPYRKITGIQRPRYSGTN